MKHLRCQEQERGDSNNRFHPRPRPDTYLDNKFVNFENEIKNENFVMKTHLKSIKNINLPALYEYFHENNFIFEIQNFTSRGVSRSSGGGMSVVT